MAVLVGLAVLVVRVAVVAVAVLVGLAVAVFLGLAVLVVLVAVAAVAVLVGLAVLVVRVAVAAVAVLVGLAVLVVRVGLVRAVGISARIRPLEREDVRSTAAALGRLGRREPRLEFGALRKEPRRAVGRRLQAQRVRDGREVLCERQAIGSGVELRRAVGGRARHDEDRFPVRLDDAAGGAVRRAVDRLRDEAELVRVLLMVVVLVPAAAARSSPEARSPEARRICASMACRRRCSPSFYAAPCAETAAATSKRHAEADRSIAALCRCCCERTCVE